jgi:lipopolysaccharide transport system permease protein
MNSKLTALPPLKRVPVYVIEPSDKWRVLDLQELWNFRDLLISFAWRDIRVRYRQTFLGAIWVVLQPLMGAVVFSIVFHTVAHLPEPIGVPYFFISYTGLLSWSLFSNTLTKSSNSLVNNAHLLSKVYFPRLFLPLSTVLSCALDCAVSLLAVIVAMLATGMMPSPHLILLPIWLLLLVLLATGIGLHVGALMVPYRDVQHILPVFMQLLLYASPVGYSLSQALAQVPYEWHLFFYANPLSCLIEACRWSLLGHGHLPGIPLLYSALFALVFFLTGLVSFRSLERKFADVI